MSIQCEQPKSLSSAEPTIELIEGDGVITYRLPARVLANPDAALRRFPRTRWLLILPVGLSFCAYVGFVWGTLPIVGIGLLCLPMFQSESLVKRFYQAIETHRTRGMIQFRSGELTVGEETPYRARWWKESLCRTKKFLDPCDIGRLRINYQTCDFDDPCPWSQLDHQGFSLVADNHNGSEIGVIAHAYCEQTLLKLANELKRDLDAYRVKLDQRVRVANPGVAIPDVGDGIPVCFGTGLIEPDVKPDRPFWSEFRFKRKGNEILIRGARSSDLEASDFRANQDRIVVTRHLLLGKIIHEIESKNLVGIYVHFEQVEPIDCHELCIEHNDAKSQRPETLRLLKGFTAPEICWIAAELREACPSKGNRAFNPSESTAFQFSIAHVLFGTLLFCLFFACVSMFRHGWMLGIQAVIVTLCLVSFTGIPVLTPYTDRSWSKVEISLVSVLCAFLTWVWFLQFSAS